MSAVHKKIVLAGGTGFIGAFLTKHFNRQGCQVSIVSRWPPFIQWSDEKGLVNALEDSDLLVNLAGKSVNCRFTPQNKEEIILSRVETTRLLGQAIGRCLHPPGLWINFSGAAIYGDKLDHPVTEQGSIESPGFLAESGRRWEEAFNAFSHSGTRQVLLRTCLVLGHNSEALRAFSGLVRLGWGGSQGRGGQMVSWVHIEDLSRIIEFIRDTPEWVGPVNCASPGPVTNREFMKALRKALHFPFGLPMPLWLVKAGARLKGTEPALALQSSWVLPERLVKAGFSFKYPEILPAMKSIL